MYTPSRSTQEQDEILKRLEAREERARLCYDNLPMFCEFFLRWEKDPKRRIKLVDIHIEMLEAALKHRDLVIIASPGIGKCMAAGSPVQLANGVQVPIETITEPVDISGFDPRTGAWHRAKAGPAIDNGVRDCVRIRFKSGRETTVTLNHRLWKIGGWTFAEDVQVGDMLGAVRRLDVDGDRHIAPDEAELLGYMVAEGACKYPSPHWSNHDQGIVARMRELCAARSWQLKQVISNGAPVTGDYYLTGRGSDLKPGAWCRSWGINTLAKHKRVPEALFRANEDAVAAFLGAVIAGDGHVSTKNNYVEIGLASHGLVLDLRQLLLRIGVVSQVTYKAARCNGKVFDSWRVSVRTSGGIRRLCEKVPIVGSKMSALRAIAERRMQRADTIDVVPIEWQRIHPKPPTRRRGMRTLSESGRLPKRGSTRDAVRAYLLEAPCEEVQRAVHPDLVWDEVVEVERLAGIQTYGISVEHDSHAYLSDGLIHHNTNLITYGLTIWEAGHRPETYTSVIGSKLKNPNATKLTRTIRSYVEANKYVQMVFPKLRPSEDRWNIEELSVAAHHVAIRDPTWAAIGNDAGWQGSRHSRQVFDDMIDKILARSKYLCEQQADWVHSGFDRLDPDGKRTFIQNRYRRWDTGVLLAEKYGWHLHLACERDAKTGASRMPDKYTEEYIASIPRSLVELYRDCKPPKEADKTFQGPHIDKCRLIGLGTTLIGSLDHSTLPDGMFVVHGVDPAGGIDESDPNDEGGDDTVIMTALVGPPSAFLDRLPLKIEEARIALAQLPDRAQIIQILWITKGKLGAPETKAAIVDLERRYGGVFMVEKNGVQKWLRQLLSVEYPHIPVQSWRTGSNKHDEMFGIKAMADELATGLWAIPTTRAVDEHGVMQLAFQSEQSVEDLIEHMEDYDPSTHTPDDITAMWLCRCAARKFNFRHAVGVAGDEITDDELYALGFEPNEVAEVMSSIRHVPKPSASAAREGTMDESKKAPEAPKKSQADLMRESQERQLRNHVRSIVKPAADDDLDEETLEEVRSKYF